MLKNASELWLLDNMNINLQFQTKYYTRKTI